MRTDWPARPLIVAPHADDETVGCGGLIARLRAAQSDVFVLVAVLDRDPRQPTRPDETRQREWHAALATLGVAPRQRCWELLPEGVRPDVLPWRATIRGVEEALRDVQPTSVFVPYPSHHQDHARLYRAALAALRPGGVPGPPPALVAAYEYPYIDTWPPPALPAGRFVADITTTLEVKLAAWAQYVSQLGAGRYLTPERLRALARRRGEEIGVAYGEAYYLLRGVLR